MCLKEHPINCLLTSTLDAQLRLTVKCRIHSASIFRKFLQVTNLENIYKVAYIAIPSIYQCSVVATEIRSIEPNADELVGENKTSNC